MRVSPSIVRAITALQHTVQLDEGGRGIAALVRPGQLLAAAQTLMQPADGGVLVLTGFPCLRERSPPVETDGPPGAVSLARTLRAVGSQPVTMLIEDHSEAALRLCAAAAAGDDRVPLDVSGFPVADQWQPADDERLERLRASSSSLVCIERAGESLDGVCYTMRGLPMGASLLGKLNSLAAPTSGLRTVGIGDGGNELGLGSLYDEVCAAIPNGPKIGCVTAVDAVLVASVSNWGGYALSCAVALLAWDRGSSSSILSGLGAAADDPSAFVRATVGDSTVVRNVLMAANEGGFVCGISGATAGVVDGMPLEKQIEVFEQLCTVTSDAMAASARGAAGAL